mmetsp:Transcript_14125/g.38894  ORF Transcript_14125/g.38894 Transcript_14125/m.38894 type:complete len:120 (-) Transcript_14125:1871-2230(-)
MRRGHPRLLGQLPAAMSAEMKAGRARMPSMRAVAKSFQCTSFCWRSCKVGKSRRKKQQQQQMGWKKCSNTAGGCEDGAKAIDDICDGTLVCIAIPFPCSGRARREKQKRCTTINESRVS